MAIGAGHALWGAVAYRRPLREIARARFVDSVGDGIFQRRHSDDARAAAFWFMFTAPLAVWIGALVESASRNGDAQALRLSARAGLATAAAGITVIPRSGFPLLPPVAYWLMREAARLERG